MDIREDYGFEGERGFFHESLLRGIKKFIRRRLRQNSEETKRFVGIIRKFRTIVTIDVLDKLLPCG